MEDGWIDHTQSNCAAATVELEEVLNNKEVRLISITPRSDVRFTSPVRLQDAAR